MKDLIRKYIRNVFNLKSLLLFVGLGLATCAAYYSVIGITTLFVGAAVSTGIMAIFLELGKIVGVCFLYRYWNKCHGFLKVYLSIATLIIMIITTCGVGSLLLAAYQKSSIEFKAGQEKIAMIEGQKTYLSDKIAQSKSQIDVLNKRRALQESRMNESLTNAFLTRSPVQFKQLQDQTVEMIKTADANIGTEQIIIQKTTDNISEINQQVNEMKFASANKKDIRTFQFVADQFGTTLDTVAKWFIFTIIFVFDPLAIALILAYNVATYKKPDELTKMEFHEKLPIINSPEPTNFEISKEEIVDLYPKSVTNLTSSASNLIPVDGGKLQPRPSWLH